MIRILDSYVADKIAAGEVIDRPVSAAKELIENSIDAGSRSIIMDIRGGGITYMRVTDDGQGISSSDIELSTLRHATSKISKIKDLDNITSLGFRGEALASIAAVSRLTIISKTKDDISGTKLQLHAGKILSRENIGSNPGTTVIIEDLFYNTPARRKFLKSAAREASAIIEMMQHYAIYYADIRFMMINNSETIFKTNGDGDTASTIKALYPDKAHSDLIEVVSENISGFVSPPGSSINSRKGELFYVNGRKISSKVIEAALESAYEERIFSGFPCAILFINIDPHDVDVNIHPGKKEILFLHPGELSEQIKAAVKKAINAEASVPVYANDIKNDFVSVKESADEIHEQTSIRDYLSNLDNNERSDKQADRSDKPNKQAEIYNSEQSFRSYITLSESFDFNNLKYAGYIFDTYIIMESSDSLYVFDQHAAHERIFYEKLMREYKSGERISQSLLTPFNINVSNDIYLLKDEIVSALNSFGFEASDFGTGSFIIRAIPSYMSNKEAYEFVNAFCNYDDKINAVNQNVIDKLIMKSCKSAVKGGDKLSEMEISNLIQTLFDCENPYSCPHGRPVFIKITKYETERAFKRR